MMRGRFYRVAWMGLAFFAAGCGITGLTLEDEGVVRFVGVEGGCWVIDVGDTRLEPINLAEDFQTDGLLVSFVAEERADLASICQVGRIIEISSISLRGG